MKHYHCVLLVFSVSAGLVSCTETPTQAESAPAALSTSYSTQMPLPSPSSRPSSRVPPQPSATAGATLPVGIDTVSDSGPWILLYKSERLWLADQQGGVKDLGHAPLWGATPVNVSYSGEYVAIVTQDGDIPFIQIKSLPDGAEHCRFPLIDSSLPEGSGWKAVWSPDSVVWSPTGNVIAIAAALDAPATDLYLVNPTTCRLRRMTSGDLQASSLHWSPDGRYVVHISGELGTGAGDYVDALWATASDGSGNEYLYPGPQAEEDRYRDRSGGEHLLGWLTPTTFLVTSWDASWGGRDLRSFDVTTKELYWLWPDRIDRLAYDPSSKAILLSNIYPPNPPMFPNDTGLFLLRPGKSPQLVASPANQISWFTQPGFFLASTLDGYTTVYPDGEATLLTPPASDCRDPLPNPNGEYWAWECPDAVVVSGPSSPAQIAFQGDTSSLFWSPDGDFLFIFPEAHFGTVLKYDPLGDETFEIAAGMSGATEVSSWFR